MDQKRLDPQSQAAKDIVVKGGTTFIAFVVDPDGYKIELIQRT